ncbi:hypothetical protein VYU27_007321 [Nannochloropsis oceanica]
MCHRVVTFIIALIATSSGAFIVPSFTSFSSATLSSSSQSPFHSHRTISMAPSGVPPVAPSNFLFASPNDDSPPSSSNPLTPLLIRLGYKTDTAAEDPRTLREKLKDFGLAGVVSYIASEVLFWFISLPVGIFAFHQSTGEWLDLSTSEGQGKVAAFSAGFLTFARVALPLRAAVALALTPALDKYVVRPLVVRGLLNGTEEE